MKRQKVMSMNKDNDFYSSEAFQQLMQAIQDKFGKIEGYTVCHSFESPEYLEYLATVKEEGEEDIPEEEQLEVEYPDFDYEGEIDSFYCGDVEYETRRLDGIIPVLVPLDEEDDEDIERDEYVIEAIIEREECELLDDIEGDKQAIDYFSEHSNEFSEKHQKRLEEMRRSYSEY